MRWFLFGAQAAILHGAARLTADVDVTVELGERSSAELAGVLAEAGFELRVADIAGFVEATRVLPFVHRASRIPVDVVLAGPGLEEQFFAGVEERVVGNARMPVVCAEDLVAMKVLEQVPAMEGPLQQSQSGPSPLQVEVVTAHVNDRDDIVEVARAPRAANWSDW